MKSSRKLCMLLAVMVCLSAYPHAMGEEVPPAETPAVQDTPAAQETPAVQETPVVEEAPAAEETPAAAETPAVAETPESSVEPSEQPLTPEPAPEPFLQVDETYVKDGLIVSRSGLEKKIQVSSNTAWTVKAKAEWIALSTVEGGFELRIGENTGEARASEIELHAEGCKTIVIPVVQEAAPAETPIAPDIPGASDTPDPAITPGMSDMPDPSVTPDLTDTPTPSEDPSVTAEATLPAEPGQTPAVDDAIDDQLPEDVPEAEPPAISAPARDYSIGWKGVVRSDEAGMAIPMLFQGDYRTIILYYNGMAKSVATSGCGATSVSMVVAYLTGNVEQNPYLLFCEAVDAGKYHGNGLSHDTLRWLADAYDVKTRWIANDAESIIAALEEGKPVIAHMGEGIFTQRGHYIVLRGLTEDGKVLVNDPNSRSNCGKAFPIETLLAQARTDHSFMVCWSDVEPEPTETVDPTATATADPEETPAPAETLAPTETPAVTELPVQPSEVPVRFETVLLYDVNGSGSVDINDAQWLYAMLAAYESGEIAYEDILRYDLDGDGNLTQDDLACLMTALSEPLEAERTCEIPLPSEEVQPEEKPEAPALEESVSEKPVMEAPMPEAEQPQA